MSHYPGDHVFRAAEDRCIQIPALTAGVFGDVLATSCHHLRATQHAEQASHLNRLVEAGAWTDAALAMIAIELPQWQLRRLAYDGGEWHCTLSSHREMPEWLDQSIETHHADLPQALLNAFLEAQQESAPPPVSSVPGTRKRSTEFESVPCDNYV